MGANMDMQALIDRN